ncbi:MAG: glycosyltransferase, partial [Gemmatimonadota bacterium]|nr:glycosyltransferase [Gemmatimonadota bacterium]
MMTHSVERVSVLVPSYRRPDSLARCLAALAAQTRPPDEVVVGVREGDTETADAAAAARQLGLTVCIATTDRTGVVASMQAALDAATGDIIALTDDDTRPFADWIAGLLAHFASSPTVGGVGGRDWQPHERSDVQRVGIVQWFGRVIGNHHLGAGPARDVDVLKGANCAFRAPLLRAVGFDARLLGEGAQMYWELGVCLPMRRAGWRLIYDPAVAVHHDVAPRHNDDNLHRGIFSEPPLRNAVHNETVEMLEGRGLVSRAVYLTWALLVGTREGPGFVQHVRRVVGGDPTAAGRWRA